MTPGRSVIAPPAELDIATAPQLGTAILDSLAHGNRNLVLDSAASS